MQNGRLAARLESAVRALPQSYPGPGGACAVLHRGETLIRHAWGYANAERRIPFTPQTLFRICSISKQFTCAAVLDAFPDPAVLDAAIAASLPRLTQPAPTARQLCHNQSGLRDYWAVAMLHGAPAESAFGDTEAQAVIGGARTLHFTPGTRYSYANQNFRLLSDALQTRTGRGFAAHLASLFDRAGMHTALLAADTAAMPDGTQGYEGSPETGHRPAVNRILWTGDAGIGASLDDMIAWERHIDATRDDPGSLYQRLSAPVQFGDGAPAAYGFGLGRPTVLGRAATGHGGALRGWRSHRVVLPAERLSVVVLFNHLSDANEAALDLLRAALDESQPPRAPFPAPDWLGAYLEPETGLAARITADAQGRLRLRFGHNAEWLETRQDGTARCTGTGTILSPHPGEDAIRMQRPAENLTTLLRRPPDAADVHGLPGRYRCAELDAYLTIADAGGMLYGGFSGMLGAGRMEALERIAPTLWALPCPRALDHTPPGDWTLHLTGDGGVRVGCWLARGLLYVREG
jgi:D-aminopeptidase